MREGERLPEPHPCVFLCFQAAKVGGYCYHASCRAFAVGDEPIVGTPLVPSVAVERMRELERLGAYQTRGVLAAAYGGRNAQLAKRGMLTHLVHVYDEELALCGTVKPGHLVDVGAYTEDELAARPTCKPCGRTWDDVWAVRLGREGLK